MHSVILMNIHFSPTVRVIALSIGAALVFGALIKGCRKLATPPSSPAKARRICESCARPVEDGAAIDLIAGAGDITFERVCEHCASPVRQ